MRKRVALAVASGAVMLLGLVAEGAGAAFPGANGRIAFTHDAGVPGTTTHIFSIDPSGANIGQLTSGLDRDANASYSPDGERIVFARNPRGRLLDGQIWIMKADGTGQIPLTGISSPSRDSRPAFTPDGTRIVFQRHDQIWIMNADGSAPRQLTIAGPNGDESQDPAVAPSGTRIAFTRFDGSTGGTGIATMNLDGTGISLVTPTALGSADFNPDFSPDGQRIVFTRTMGTGDEVIAAVNADGSSPALITSATPAFEGHSPAFSPQGTQVVFELIAPAQAVANLAFANPAGVDLGLAPLTRNQTANVRSFDPSWQPLNPPSCSLGKTLKLKTYGKVTVTATCANENAFLVASGKGKAKPPKKGAARKAKKFTIPAVNALVAAGVPTPVTLKISKQGREALKAGAKAGKKGKATITGTVVDDLGQTATTSVKVEFKAKKKRK